MKLFSYQATWITPTTVIEIHTNDEPESIDGEYLLYLSMIKPNSDSPESDADIDFHPTLEDAIKCMVYDFFWSAKHAIKNNTTEDAPTELLTQLIKLETTREITVKL